MCSTTWRRNFGVRESWCEMPWWGYLIVTVFVMISFLVLVVYLLKRTHPRCPKCGGLTSISSEWPEYTVYFCDRRDCDGHVLEDHRAVR
ncbi:hypothetical protein LCGC14_1395190 [marine sediment metagenome]|uniref:Uncharacterized protein n=1 Tax=marine sediment metagenome TaxID=412755 RepID=A0A0F9N0B2_9ZZZZ